VSRLAWLLGAALFGCGGLFGASRGPDPAPAVAAPPPSFLVIVVDDVGVDKVGAYAEHPHPAKTPRIDALAARGVLFRNAYTSPVCSSSRANLLTGRHGRRNGMGGIVGMPGETWELPLSEVVLPELLARGAVDYDTAAIGKWHLSGPRTANAGRHPNLQGFEHYAGSLTNIDIKSRASKGRDAGYFGFEKTVNGEVGWRSGVYATTDETDDAIAWLDRAGSPFLLVVGYHAAHEPHHVPPPSLMSGPPPRADAPRADLYDAALEAMDTEIGRLLASLDERQQASTVIVFVGDNGTMREAVRPPWNPDDAKATLHEGGTNVPLVIAGAGIARGEAKALVHTVDVFATLAELAGVPSSDLVLDGKSLTGVLRDPASEGPREIVYTERFAPLGPGPYEVDLRAVRDGSFKVLQRSSGDRAWFDLRGRDDDGPAVRKNATPDREVYLRLERELDELDRTLIFDVR
jgi:arylsulfatase A-like enzyme